MERLVCQTCGAPLRGSVCDYCGSRYKGIEIETEPANDYEKGAQTAYSCRMYDRNTKTWVWRPTHRPDPLGTVVTN